MPAPILTRRDVIVGASAASLLGSPALALPFPPGLFDGREATGSVDARFGSGLFPDARAILPLHGGARRVWLDTTAGGSGDGRSAATAYSDPGRAYAAWRPGDQLMIAGGSEIVEPIGDLRGRSGRSLAYPTVVQSYDRDAPDDEARHGLLTNNVVYSGAQPMFGASLSSQGTEFVAIRGLKLLHTPDANGRLQYSFSAGLDGLLIEQCIFLAASLILGVTAPSSQHVVRQCAFRGQWSAVSHASGIFFGNNFDAVIEDCTFYHNGWRDGVARTASPREGGPTVFNHGLYAAVKTAGVLRRSVFIAPSSHGAQLRGNWVSHDNVFIACPLGLVHGQGTRYAQDAPEGVRAHAYRNIVANGADITPRQPRGIGIEVANTQPGSLVEQSLIVAPEAPKVLAALAAAAFVGVGYDPNPTYIAFTRNTNAWSMADYKSGSRHADGWPARVHVESRDNIDPDDGIAFADPTRSGRTAAKALGLASIDAMGAAATASPYKPWADAIARHIKAGYVPKPASFAKLRKGDGSFRGAILPDGSWNDGRRFKA